MLNWEWFCGVLLHRECGPAEAWCFVLPNSRRAHRARNKACDDECTLQTGGLLADEGPDMRQDSNDLPEKCPQIHRAGHRG
jgi:hypothetical protein